MHLFQKPNLFYFNFWILIFNKNSKNIILIKTTDITLMMYNKLGQKSDGEMDLKFANTQTFKI
jgi:hypothetical protein